ncbi:MAG: F0F1 ATP synthase subunit A [Candidatus Stahlbacteria bacterium]|nr:F0F1 ATP synthase subunit A [Candidatus Stahlbacteria bacterium]
MIWCFCYFYPILSITNTLIASWLTIIVLVGVAFIATRRMRVIPGRVQNFIEIVIEGLLNFVDGVAGKENGRKFFPVIATIFIFVITNAWLSLLPGFGSITYSHIHLLRGANTDINVPLAIAVVSFIFVEYCGIRSQGFFHYIGKFINVSTIFIGLGQIFRGKLKSALNNLFIGIINAFIGLLEGISELVRMVSFTFRLFGNMTAGEILLLIATFLSLWIVPIPFYGLELLVGFIQALIFSSLTLVFATTAVTSTHEEHGEEKT